MLFFSIAVYHRIVNDTPCRHSRPLFVHPMYTGLQQLIPDSLSFLPLLSPGLALTSLFSTSVSLSLFCR